MRLEHCQQAYILRSNPEAENELTGKDMCLWNLPASSLSYNSSNKSIPPNIFPQISKNCELVIQMYKARRDIIILTTTSCQGMSKGMTQFPGDFPWTVPCCFVHWLHTRVWMCARERNWKKMEEGHQVTWSVPSPLQRQFHHDLSDTSYHSLDPHGHKMGYLTLFSLSQGGVTLSGKQVLLVRRRHWT